LEHVKGCNKLLKTVRLEFLSTEENCLSSLFQEEGLISFDEKLNKEFDLKKDFEENNFRDFLKLADITDNQKRETVLENDYGVWWGQRTDGNPYEDPGILKIAEKIKHGNDKPNP